MSENATNILGEGATKIVYESSQDPDIAIAYVKRTESGSSRYERYGQQYCNLMKATHDLAVALFPGQFNVWYSATYLIDNPKFSAEIYMKRLDLMPGQSTPGKINAPAPNANELLDQFKLDGGMDDLVDTWKSAGITELDLAKHNFNFDEKTGPQFVDEIKPYKYIEDRREWLIDEVKVYHYIRSIQEDSRRKLCVKALNNWRTSIKEFNAFKKSADVVHNQ